MMKSAEQLIWALRIVGYVELANTLEKTIQKHQGEEPRAQTIQLLAIFLNAISSRDASEQKRLLNDDTQQVRPILLRLFDEVQQHSQSPASITAQDKMNSLLRDMESKHIKISTHGLWVFLTSSRASAHFPIIQLNALASQDVIYITTNEISLNQPKGDREQSSFSPAEPIISNTLLHIPLNQLVYQNIPQSFLSLEDPGRALSPSPSRLLTLLDRMAPLSSLTLQNKQALTLHKDHIGYIDSPLIQAAQLGLLNKENIAQHVKSAVAYMTNQDVLDTLLPSFSFLKIPSPPALQPSVASEPQRKWNLFTPSQGCCFTIKVPDAQSEKDDTTVQSLDTVALSIVQNAPLSLKEILASYLLVNFQYKSERVCIEESYYNEEDDVYTTVQRRNYKKPPNYLNALGLKYTQTILETLHVIFSDPKHAASLTQMDLIKIDKAKTPSFDDLLCLYVKVLYRGEDKAFANSLIKHFYDRPFKHTLSLLALFKVQPFSPLSTYLRQDDLSYIHGKICQILVDYHQDTLKITTQNTLRCFLFSETINESLLSYWKGFLSLYNVLAPYIIAEYLQNNSGPASVSIARLLYRGEQDELPSVLQLLALDLVTAEPLLTAKKHYCTDEHFNRALLSLYTIPGAGATVAHLKSTPIPKMVEVTTQPTIYTYIQILACSDSIKPLTTALAELQRASLWPEYWKAVFQTIALHENVLTLTSLLFDIVSASNNRDVIQNTLKNPKAYHDFFSVLLRLFGPDNLETKINYYLQECGAVLSTQRDLHTAAQNFINTMSQPRETPPVPVQYYLKTLIPDASKQPLPTQVVCVLTQKVNPDDSMAIRAAAVSRVNPVSSQQAHEAISSSTPIVTRELFTPRGASTNHETLKEFYNEL